MSVRVVEYIPAWPSEFAVIARRLRKCLGPLAVRIDHIGSTSVPRLAAKNVIDVQVTVEALDVDTKDPVCEARARLTGWQPGASDG